jgi:hypothetical protein
VVTRLLKRIYTIRLERAMVEKRVLALILFSLPGENTTICQKCVCYG